MSGSLLSWVLLISQCLLGLTVALAGIRLYRGPRSEDRVLSLDCMYIAAMLLFITFGISMQNDLFFELALGIALVGFVSSLAFAKFLMRGEVIE
jgi:Multisubunit Na+/H+ antiporter, MnhF subunit